MEIKKTIAQDGYFCYDKKEEKLLNEFFPNIIAVIDWIEETEEKFNRYEVRENRKEIK